MRVEACKLHLVERGEAHSEGLLTAVNDVFDHLFIALLLTIPLMPEKLTPDGIL